MVKNKMWEQMRVILASSSGVIRLATMMVAFFVHDYCESVIRRITVSEVRVESEVNATKMKG